MDSDEGRALWGSPNGEGIGWLLAQHKEQFGIKTVTSVTVFLDEAQFPAYNLAFKIANYSP